MQALVFDPPRIRWPLAWLAGRVAPRALLGPLGGLRLREVAEPALPGGAWVRLRPRLAGICGSDLAMVMLRNHPATILQCFATFPSVLGHENVSDIVEVGADVRGWRVGQRACVDPCLSCRPRHIQPVCAQCAAGRPSLCENPDRGDLPAGLILGVCERTGGTWSSSFVAHASQLVAVPDSLPDEIAVLVDPIACAAHAVLRRGPRDGERVLILGGGIVALGVMAAIRALDRRNRVIAVVRHADQADRMRRFGADDVRIHPRDWRPEQRYDDMAAALDGRRRAARFGNQAFLGGVGLTYDCVGSGASLTDAMKWTAARGTVCLVGTTQIAVVDVTPLWLNELEVVGCNGRQIETFDERPRHTYEVVFDWLASGRLDLSGLLTHRFPLRDYRAAFETLTRRGGRGVVKVAFEPS